MKYERFLEKLKELRKAKGYSLQTLSKKTGISASYLSLIERKNTMLGMEKFLKICEGLEIEPYTLFEENPQGFDERLTAAKQLMDLPERKFRVVKDLILLWSLSDKDT